MFKKQLIIGTTSINRPLLHNDNINGWYNWINKIDKEKYELNWFINIDFIEKLETSVSETKQNFENIIKDIKIHFLESDDGKGNFLKACKRVSTNIVNFVNENNFNLEDIIIIWLEDDWKLNEDNLDIEYIIENYLSNLSYINLSYIRNNYIQALAPSIINYNLWFKVQYTAWKEQEKHIDPEHCVGLYFLKNFIKYEKLDNLTIIRKTIKDDFFNQGYLNLEKSYYTYYKKENYEIFNDKYIEKENIKDFFKDKITFMRISNSLCIDGVNYGRNFMKNYDLIKKRVQNENNIEFYN